MGEKIFYSGDKVKLNADYRDVGNETFEVSQVSVERKRCWIGDKQGRGWFASFGMLVLVRRAKR